MVERTTSNNLDEFKGTIENINIEESEVQGKKHKQYHISIKPLDVEIKGKTGLIHEWIRITDKCTEGSVPEGSVIDRYIQQIEILHPECKKLATITEVFQVLVGNSYQFQKLKLGKSFDGKDAKEYIVPVKKE